MASVWEGFYPSYTFAAELEQHRLHLEALVEERTRLRQEALRSDPDGAGE